MSSAPFRNYAKFTPEEDARIIADAAAGVPRQVTADALMRTINSINLRAGWLRRIAGEKVPCPRRANHYEIKPNARPSKSERPCMRCHEEFKSEGPHNRLCQRCKEAARHVSPYAPL